MRYSRIRGAIDQSVAGIAGGVLAVDILLIAAGVVLRPLGISYALFDEFPRLLQSLVSFLMVGILLKYKGHVNVDMLTTKLRGRALTTFELISYLLTCGAAIFLLASSFDTMMATRSLKETTQSEIHFYVWYIMIAQVTGFVFLLVAATEGIIDKTSLLFLRAKQTNLS